MSEPAKIYTCPDPDCDETFTNHKSVGPHMKAHKPEVACDVCGLPVKNMAVHKARIHPQGDDDPNLELKRLQTENRRLRASVASKDVELRNARGALRRARDRLGVRSV